MNKFVYVLSSSVKKDTPIKLKPFAKGLDFDVKFLCSDPKEKILKKDVDLDLSELDEYDLVCPVGAEALKYVCGVTGILKYAGNVVNERYVPITKDMGKYKKLFTGLPSLQQDDQETDMWNNVFGNEK